MSKGAFALMNEMGLQGVATIGLKVDTKVKILPEDVFQIATNLANTWRNWWPGADL